MALASIPGATGCVNRGSHMDDGHHVHARSRQGGACMHVVSVVICRRRAQAPAPGRCTWQPVAAPPHPAGTPLRAPHPTFARVAGLAPQGHLYPGHARACRARRLEGGSRQQGGRRCVREGGGHATPPLFVAACWAGPHDPGALAAPGTPWMGPHIWLAAALVPLLRGDAGPSLPPAGHRHAG